MRPETSGFLLSPFSLSKAIFLPSQWRSFEIKSSSSSKCHIRILATAVPAINPDRPQPLPSPSTNGSPKWPLNLNPSSKGSSARSEEWRVYADNNGKNGRWHKENESALRKDEPLPLPMAYPDSRPDPQEVENMKNCDPAVKDCTDVLYQWTGKCSRCQGTGEVSHFRKKGREVICKCIPCLGLGYVYKMTRRTEIEVEEDINGAL